MYNQIYRPTRHSVKRNGDIITVRDKNGGKIHAHIKSGQARALIMGMEACIKDELYDR